MTITIDAETEARFRRHVAARFGTKKGAIGKAVDEALLEWTQRHETDPAFRELLHRSVARGGSTYTSREELHDRR